MPLRKASAAACLLNNIGVVIGTLMGRLKATKKLNSTYNAENRVGRFSILTLPTMGLLEQPQILGGGTMYPLLVMNVPLVLS